MLNRPFSSTNINIIDEKTQNTSPASIGGQNVLVSQEQHQKIFNTLTTSISGMQGNYPSIYQNSQYYPLPHQNHANAVTFTFNGNQFQPFYPQTQPYWQCQLHPAMQNLNQLQQANAIDLMQLQHHFSQPQQWSFHMDNQTSTTDLTTKSITRPDLSNLSGILKSKWPYWLETPLSKNHKKLTLKHVTAKLEDSICDQLDLSKEKTVSFDLDAKKNAETQARLCCTSCCVTKNDNTTVVEAPKPPKRHKKKGKKRTTSPSDGSTEEDFEDVR